MTTIFVFGSNLAGRHGKGAALEARLKHGAIYGQGIGPQGNSYGIPTKDNTLTTLPLEDIKEFVIDFIRYAMAHGELKFNVTRIGCGLAGYEDEDIAPMFKNAPRNCVLPAKWIRINNPVHGLSQHLMEQFGNHDSFKVVDISKSFN